MSSLFKTFKTITTLEKDGKWFPFSANDDGTIPRFLLARMGATNPAYQAAIENASRELRRDLDLEILTEDRASPVMKRVFVDTILKGWENVQDADNIGIAFSKEMALALFDELPDLYLALVTEAKRLSNYREQNAGVVAEKH